MLIYGYLINLLMLVGFLLSDDLRYMYFRTTWIMRICAYCHILVAVMFSPLQPWAVLI
jgi:hypothetical protein